MARFLLYERNKLDQSLTCQVLATLRLVSSFLTFIFHLIIFVTFISTNILTLSLSLGWKKGLQKKELGGEENIPFSLSSYVANERFPKFYFMKKKITLIHQVVLLYQNLPQVQYHLTGWHLVNQSQKRQLYETKRTFLTEM